MSNVRRHERAVVNHVLVRTSNHLRGALAWAGRIGFVILVAVQTVSCYAHVEEPELIDLISMDKDRAEVQLSVVQQNPWDDRTLSLLKRKTANYVAFVKSGTLQKERPVASGKSVAIEVWYFIEPDERALQVLSGLQLEYKSLGIALRWRKLPGKQ
jgi:hypothetical protein